VRLLCVAAVLGLTLAGCQRAPALAPAASVEVVGSDTVRLKAEGDELVKQQQYEQAIVKYQAALAQAPSDIPIRFALAVALSHTPRRDETVEHFRFVLERGAPGSAEVRMAREWLVGAGEPATGSESVATTAPTTGSSPASSATASESEVKRGRLLGKIAWKDIEPRTRMVRVNVSLVGDEVENRDVKLGRPDFKIGKGYEFRSVPAGAYRLVAEAGGTPMWDLKVVVPAEKDTTLDLTESNATVASSFEPPTD
jgi:hypothetical protein